MDFYPFLNDKIDSFFRNWIKSTPCFFAMQQMLFNAEALCLNNFRWNGLRDINSTRFIKKTFIEKKHRITLMLSTDSPGHSDEFFCIFETEFHFERKKTRRHRKSTSAKSILSLKCVMDSHLLFSAASKFYMNRRINKCIRSAMKQKLWSI